jgi:GntR family transcriptional regulator, hexuronate regulon transcriptional repressor
MDEGLGQPSSRLYQEIARKLVEELAAGKYPIGSRLPAERDLAARYGVSRPTIRETMIALEVQGLIEVRIGAGAYVLRLPGSRHQPGFDLSAFELTEARLLIEGEAAALAATQVTDEDIEELEDLAPEGTEDADRRFHITLARLTRNGAIRDAVAQLWRLRTESPESALLHAKARHANIKPVVDEHAAILSALRRRDPAAARAAMRTHLSAVLDSLLFATEERAIEEARRASEQKRARYAHANG